MVRLSLDHHPVALRIERGFWRYHLHRFWRYLGKVHDSSFTVRSKTPKVSMGNRPILMICLAYKQPHYLTKYKCRNIGTCHANPSLA
ncbi:hypothetical protein MPNT_270003 [Candidatus Methylacidithermus pantelleriae]|uniref:Uncharacterized protein n=1 Tax=Candidatus Methylacidithermus pantelleriae TaxID=2744239 RepID=A0A8J2FWB7_9BACT|nr:hypothetical protein MPNT_270003 [Candidatus Methylacidithermus pantelleriae]